MKRIAKNLLAALVAALLVLSFASCGKTADTQSLWENAAYTVDTELGTGSKTVIAEMALEDKSVKFTIHTDAATVGAALLEQGIISGDAGEFGLYVKVVNGITADYDIDRSYWAFYIDGELAMSGVDTTDIAEGSVYRLVYTK